MFLFKVRSSIGRERQDVTAAVSGIENSCHGSQYSLEMILGIFSGFPS